jgi:hypothetical protein
MKQILTLFFSQDEFWQRFKVVNERHYHKTYTVNYRFDSKYHKIALRFIEFDSVKAVCVIHSGKEIINLLYFLSLDELNLILNRVPQIRAANPLCSDSLSIKALSSSVKNLT